MRFNTRNAYYLRVSANTVLPLYLYLDEQHVDWMSERVLQHVLADLRPLIIPKLIAEDTVHLGPGGPTSAKKGTLDVHRGDTYQFGYFLRNTEPHAVLIKTRRFTAAPPKPKHAPQLHEPVDPLPEEEDSVPKKRGRVSKKRKEPATKKRNTGESQAKGKRKGEQRATEVDSEEEAIELSGDEEEAMDTEEAQVPQAAPRRSARKRNVVTGGYREDEENAEDVIPQAQPEAEDVDMAAAEAEAPQDGGLNDANLIGMDESQEPTPAPVRVKSEQPEPTLPQPASPRPASPITLDSDPPAPPVTTNPAPDTLLINSDEEEEKPKPIMKLQYQGFSIGGRCLCVIVEPYPPLPKPPRAMSLAPTGLVAPRAPSIAPADFVPSRQQRGKTPLFLPEDDREATPAPRGARDRSRPPVPLFYEEQEDEEDDDEEGGGMLAFSQILQSVGEYATGAAEDDDDIEGAVFFGDADENREL